MRFVYILTHLTIPFFFPLVYHFFHFSQKFVTQQSCGELDPERLKGKVAYRTRELLQQGCDAKNLKILKGSIGPDHVHMLLSCPTDLAPSQIMQYLKGRSSHLLQDEFPELKRKYWGQHMWGRGYFCGTVGEVDEETIKHYIETQGIEERAENFKVVEE